VIAFLFAKLNIYFGLSKRDRTESLLVEVKYSFLIIDYENIKFSEGHLSFNVFVTSKITSC